MAPKKQIAKSADQKAQIFGKLHNDSIKCCILKNATFAEYNIEDKGDDADNTRLKEIDKLKNEINEQKKIITDINEVSFYISIIFGTKTDDDELAFMDFSDVSQNIQKKVIKNIFHLISELDENQIHELLNDYPNNAYNISQINSSNFLNTNDDERLKINGVCITLNKSCIDDVELCEQNLQLLHHDDYANIELSKDEMTQYNNLLYIYTSSVFILNLSENYKHKLKKSNVKKQQNDENITESIQPIETDIPIEKTEKNQKNQKTIGTTKNKQIINKKNNSAKNKQTNNDEEETKTKEESKVEESKIEESKAEEPKTNNRKCSICKKTGHTKIKCPNLQNDTEPEPEIKEQSTQLTKQNLKQKNKIDNDTKSTTSSNKSNHSCSLCHETGHNKRTCGKIKEEKKPSARKCSNCGNVGHNKLKCPEPPKNS